MAEFDELRPFFNGKYYRSEYPDAPGNFASPWEHFKEVGIPEHRSPSSGYDAVYYLSKNIDALNASGGRDLIMGLEGSDRLKGLRHRDEIYGNEGNDTLIGNQGSDRLFGNQGKDRLIGGTGNDRLFGNQGSDTLIGNSGRDTLIGGKNNDFLRGGTGADKLLGSAGNDSLHGDRGSDTLIGGPGNDKFFIGKNTGGDAISKADVIRDFTNGKDLIQLRSNLTFDDLKITRGSGNNTGDTIVRVRETNEYLAILKNVNRSSIDIDDFTGFAKPIPGTIALTAANFSVNESESTASIVLERTGGSDGEVSVNYTTSDGTAIAGSDYTATSGKLTFGDGQTSKAFSIPINNDSEVETDETVEITLSNPTDGSLGRSSATITISNDDVLQAIPAVISSDTVKFSPSDSEEAIAATGAPSITIGTQTIYIGTWQKSSNNQDPIIASFDSANSNNNWTRTDYEFTGADGRGKGLFWDGDDLYVTFSTDGTQGNSSEDFRRAAADAEQSWLRSYGRGGGAKIGVVAKLDETTGEMTDAAFLSSLLSSGNSNSLVITDLSVNDSGNLEVEANSWFAPRNPDGSRMTQVGSGGSPFDYTVEIAPDLSRVVSTAAVGWE
ncbi:MAG: Calx-beta domain-containing protein [Cyanobacteriota bacterium]|nr:Calx-beta domain-containing protein [Cyanobacteriota bacterium]